MPRYPEKTLFTPRNPQKYEGTNINRIIMRSAWERTMALEFDRNPAILKWSSETIKIPYKHPFKKTWTIYKPDFYVIYVDNNNKVHHALIEVKPAEESLAEFTASAIPLGTATTKKNVRLAATLAVNAAKWKAAAYVCKKLNYEFFIYTRDEIYSSRMGMPGTGRMGLRR